MIDSESMLNFDRIQELTDAVERTGGYGVEYSDRTTTLRVYEGRGEPTAVQGEEAIELLTHLNRLAHARASDVEEARRQAYDQAKREVTRTIKTALKKVGAAEEPCLCDRRAEET